MNPLFNQHHNQELANLERYYTEVESFIPSGNYEIIESVAQRIYLLKLGEIIATKKMRIAYANRTDASSLTIIMMDQVFTGGLETVDMRGEDYKFALSDDIIMSFDDQLKIIHHIMDKYHLTQCITPIFLDKEGRKRNIYDCAYFIAGSSSKNEKFNILENFAGFEEDIDYILKDKNYIFNIEAVDLLHSTPHRRGLKITCCE